MIVGEEALNWLPARSTEVLTPRVAHCGDIQAPVVVALANCDALEDVVGGVIGGSSLNWTEMHGL